MHQILSKDSGQVAEQRSSARWLEENTNWHAMVGKHVQSVSSELFTPEQRSPTALLGFTLEAAEMVTFWYMRHSSVEGGNNDEVPPLMDLLWEEKSPATVALQFYSGILTGKHLIVLCLCQIDGFATLVAMQRRKPENANRIRCVMVTAGFFIWLRHVWRVMVWPQKLVITADTRRPRSDRLAVADEFCDACKWCLDPAHSKKVRKQIRVPADLLEEPWTCRHKALARLHTLTNHACELEHARAKRQCTSQTHFAFMAARGMCLQHSDAGKAALSLEDKADRSTVMLNDDPQTHSERPRYFPNIAMWWHNHCSRRDKIAGCKHRVASKEYWAKCNKDLDDMEESERAHIIEQYETEKKAALSDRKAKKATIKVGTVAATQRPGAKQVEALQDIHPKDVSVLKPAHVESLSREHGKDTPKGFSGVKALEAEWRIKTGRYAIDTGVVPKNVHSFRICRGMCKSKATAHQFAIWEEAGQVCRRALIPLSKACKLLQVLLRVEILHTSEIMMNESVKTRHILVHDILGNGIAGLMRTAEAVLPLQESDNNTLEALSTGRGLVLDFRRRPLLKTKPSPLFTTDEVAGRLDHALFHEWLASELPSTVSKVCISE